MKLYYAPGACSLADRITLHEAGFTATFEKVDLKSKHTETGADFMAVNPKGYVPVLVLDGGQKLTENVAVLSWISSQVPELVPPGPLGYFRLIEALAFLSTEVHKSFKPLFSPGSAETARVDAAKVVAKRFEFIAEALIGPYLFGSRFTAADAYLFVMLRWSRNFGVVIPPSLSRYFDRVMERDSVRDALAEEDLIPHIATPAGDLRRSTPAAL